LGLQTCKKICRQGKRIVDWYRIAYSNQGGKKTNAVRGANRGFTLETFETRKKKKKIQVEQYRGFNCSFKGNPENENGRSSPWVRQGKKVTPQDVPDGEKKRIYCTTATSKRKRSIQATFKKKGEGG